MTPYSLMRGMLAPLFKLLFRFEKNPRFASPWPFEGAVVVANHCSNLDPVALALAIKPPLAFMAKAEMFRVPLLAFIIKAGGAFPVERGGGGRPAIEAAIAQAKAGKLVAMFPEGTRSRDGKLGALKAGAAIIALEAGVPILPFAIRGTHRALPKGRFFPRLGSRIEVVVGAPIEVAPFREEEEGVALLTERCRQALEGLLGEKP